MEVVLLPPPTVEKDDWIGSGAVAALSAQMQNAEFRMQKSRPELQFSFGHSAFCILH
jgi:hypothetical protein